MWSKTRSRISSDVVDYTRSEYIALRTQAWHGSDTWRHDFVSSAWSFLDNVDMGYTTGWYIGKKGGVRFSGADIVDEK